MLKNRKEAGQQLAVKLMKYKNTKAIVLALPRGGVVVGYEIAHALSLPLNIVTTRKIGHPSNPEFAIGVVDEHGTKILNEAETEAVDAKWLKKEIDNQQKEAQRRSDKYRKSGNPLNIKGQIVIIVDDGIATGLSMQLAVRSVKTQQPAKIIVATPVLPSSSLLMLEDEGVDEVFVLEPSENFLGSVGAYYTEFEQVDDSEVIRLLNAT